MTLRCAIMLAAAVLFYARPGFPQDYGDYDQLRAAQEHLQRAGDYLRAAPSDPQGRRDKAISYVSRALEEIHYALSGQAPPGTRERKMQDRTEQLDEKRLKREQQIEEKQLERQQQQEMR